MGNCKRLRHNAVKLYSIPTIVRKSLLALRDEFGFCSNADEYLRKYLAINNYFSIAGALHKSIFACLLLSLATE